jgi:SAM-dependent MidA family methyltransferase
MIAVLKSDHEQITLFEFGAGEGTLCQGILDCLQKTAPDILNRIAYIIIEKSPFFQTRQKERLTPLYPHTVLWFDQMPKDCIGIVLSNEFVDALPVHRMRISGAGSKPALTELYVDWKDGNFLELFHPPSLPALFSHFDRLNINFKKDFQYEVNLMALDWMRAVGESLKKGFILTIDYGYPAHQLYAPARKRGTFLCYYKHTVSEDPYQNIGQQDMTSHVDFTALARVGEEVGLQVTGFTDQTHFLMGLGIAQEMQIAGDRMHASDAAQKDFLAMKELMSPSKMGKTFKVLIQEKGITSSTTLDGLMFRAFAKDCLIR